MTESVTEVRFNSIHAFFLPSENSLLFMPASGLEGRVNNVRVAPVQPCEARASFVFRVGNEGSATSEGAEDLRLVTLV